MLKNKILTVVLLISIGLTRISLGAESLQQGQDPSHTITRQTYQRSWSFPLKELACGGVALASSYIMPGETLQDLATIVGVGFLYDGAVRLSKSILEGWAESNLREKNAIKLMTLKSLPILQQKERKAEIAEKIYSAVRLSRCRYSTVEHLINLSTTLFVGYLILSGDNTQGFQLSQYGYTLYLTIISAGSIYNANEIRHSVMTGDTRRDRPIAKISNAFTQVMLASYFFAHFGTQNLTILSGLELPILIPRQMSTSEWTLYRFLQTHGDAEAVIGVTQMLMGIYGAINSYFKPNPIVKEIKKKSSSISIKRSLSIKQSLQAPHVSPQLIPHPRQSEEGAHRTELIPSPRAPKLKTRGKADPSRAESSRTNETFKKKPRTDKPTDNDIVRTQALTRIRALSEENTVSEKTMNNEIAAMLRFLPNAERVNAGKNKDAIRLTFEGGSVFKLRFETPHQQRNASSNEYKWARKERALDVLRVCYLVGWDEHKIRQYIAENDIISFYNVPAFLIQILWERGSI